MLTSYFKKVGPGSLETAEEDRPGAWINVENATEDDIHKVAELTGLGVIDLDDSLDRYEVPRIERQNKNVIIFLRYPIDTEEAFYTDILTVVITDKSVVTISPTQCPIIHDLLVNELPFATTQKSRFLINLLLNISNSFTTHIKNVRHHVLGQKQNIGDPISDDAIAELAENEEILNQYLAALIPLQNVIQATLSGNHIEFYEDDEDLLDDLLVSSRQSADLCTVNLKSIRSVRDSYQIIFTNKLNRTMKFLTSITVILTIPTIITSFYGMNISLPVSHHPLAYLLITLGMVAFSCLVLLVFYLKKWL